MITTLSRWFNYLINGWKKFKHSYYYHHVFKPLLIVIFVELFIVYFAHPFAEKYLISSQASEAQKHETKKDFILIGLIIALIAAIITYLVEIKKFYKDFATFSRLKSILHELKYPFSGYGKRMFSDYLKNLSNQLNTLSDGGEVRMSFEEKIKLITNLLEGTDDSNEGINLFYATSFDRPSLLMKPQFQRYFIAQRRKLKRISDPSKKRRIVILDLKELDEEISNNGEVLSKFIKWHEKNGFELRFLINHNNLFEEKVQSIIGKISSSSVGSSDFLTDFAIVKLNKTWVYGELTTKKIKSSEHPSKDDLPEYLKPETFVKLYNSEREGDDIIVKDYEIFYENLWNEWQTKLWPSLSQSQVQSEIYRIEKMKQLQNSKSRYYNKYFNKEVDQVTAEDFFTKIRTLDAIKLKAIDLVSLTTENELGVWVDHDFKKWYSVNSEIVSKSGCSCERIYVINMELSNSNVAIELYESVIRPQIDAGIKIYLTTLEKLVKNDIPVHDFVFGKSVNPDNNFCISVDLFQGFDDHQFKLKGLECISRIEWYEKIFDKICSESYEITVKVPPALVAAFLCNLDVELK